MTYFQVETIPTSAIRKMDDYKAVNAIAANQAIRQLKVTDKIDISNLISRYQSGKLTLASVCGKVRHIAIANYDEIVNNLHNKVYNIVREQVSYAILDAVMSYKDVVIADNEKQLKEVERKLSHLETFVDQIKEAAQEALLEGTYDDIEELILELAS